MTITIPILESARLRLRGHRADDYENSAALWGDAEVTRHIGGRPLSREEVWGRLLRYAGTWVWMGYGYWVVEEKSTGKFVGEVGFANLQRVVQPPLENVPELGWVLTRAFHGRGYATEAVQTATAWGDRIFDSPRTTCIIDPENARSIRVAQRCGFSESHQATYKGESVIVFTRETPK